MTKHYLTTDADLLTLADRGELWMVILSDEPETRVIRRADVSWLLVTPGYAEGAAPWLAVRAVYPSEAIMVARACDDRMRRELRELDSVVAVVLEPAAASAVRSLLAGTTRAQVAARAGLGVQEPGDDYP